VILSFHKPFFFVFRVNNTFSCKLISHKYHVKTTSFQKRFRKDVFILTFTFKFIQMRQVKTLVYKFDFLNYRIHLSLILTDVITKPFTDFITRCEIFTLKEWCTRSSTKSLTIHESMRHGLPVNTLPSIQRLFDVVTSVLFVDTVLLLECY
jgi:hypothetical protein